MGILPAKNIVKNNHSSTYVIECVSSNNDALPAPPAEIELVLHGLPAEKALLQHYRIDGEYSNAYTAW